MSNPRNSAVLLLLLFLLVAAFAENTKEVGIVWHKAYRAECEVAQMNHRNQADAAAIEKIDDKITSFVAFTRDGKIATCMMIEHTR